MSTQRGWTPQAEGGYPAHTFNGLHYVAGHEPEGIARELEIEAGLQAAVADYMRGHCAYSCEIVGEKDEEIAELRAQLAAAQEKSDALDDVAD